MENVLLSNGHLYNGSNLFQNIIISVRTNARQAVHLKYRCLTEDNVLEQSRRNACDGAR